MVQQTDLRAIMELAAKFTVARMLERDDLPTVTKISYRSAFMNFLSADAGLWLRDDRCRCGIGCYRTKFNLVIARQIQKEFGKKNRSSWPCRCWKGSMGFSGWVNPWVIISALMNRQKKYTAKPSRFRISWFILILNWSAMWSGRTAQDKKQLENPQTNPVMSSAIWPERWCGCIMMPRPPRPRNRNSTRFLLIKNYRPICRNLYCAQILSPGWSAGWN